ncbi:MAG: NADH:flavin oxidoreductase [Desulfobulbaceae bacterium]|nr:NADH:flavin oxidoreductase [Desulfobulbaceae bacterium]
MAALFELTTINSMTLRNRMVRSATWEGMCEPDGEPTTKLADFYRRLAEGGIGLIITGYAFVRPEGKQLPGQMGIHTDKFAAGFIGLTDGVHEAGGKIAVQLVHAGGQTDTATAGRRPLAPSSVSVAQYSEVPDDLSREQIKEIAAAFGAAARRGRNWGFDAVQIHGAHGYLINQFLSPLTNRRRDQYGGSLENRSRFLFEVLNRVRDEVGPDYPVMIKLNAADNLEGGFTLNDARLVAQRLSETGIDAIEVSAGTPASGKESPVRMEVGSPEQEGYNLALAEEIKKSVQCPVMVVGGIRSYEVAEKIVGAAGLDYVAMARPLIREPDLPGRWKRGDRRRASCISCNSCFLPGIKEGGIYCIVKKKEEEEEK